MADEATVNNVLQTIRARESSNDYTALNFAWGNGSTASGAYQFTRPTWRGLTERYNIGTQYANAYEAPQHIQDAVARAQVSDILDRHNGDVRVVPNIWYTGNAAGRMSERALAVNNGMTAERYSEGWLRDYQRVAGGEQLAPLRGATTTGAPAGTAASAAGVQAPSGQASNLPLDGQQTSPGSLAEVAGSNSWLDNPLHEFEYYTYNLEFFTVDQQTAFNFFNNVTLEQISSDAWPAASDKKITIAKTGVTTEYNITDLEIESVGSSIADDAIIGAAHRLSFTITEVGDIKFADTLKISTQIAGYANLSNAIFFVKINFLGYDTNGTPAKLDKCTKVIAFQLSKLADITSEVTVSGQTLIIEGVVVRRSALNVENDQFDTAIEYDIGSNLQETLSNMMEAVNESLRSQNFSVEGDDKFINTYSVESLDNVFETNYMTDNPINYDGAMGLGVASTGQPSTPGSSTTMGTAQRIGMVHVGSSLLDSIKDVCLQSTKIKSVLTSDNNTFSDLFFITADVIPKVGGYNPLTNTQGCEIKYYLGIKREIIDQNNTDQIRKALNNAQILDEITSTGRLKKIYYYRYTGKNTEVLNFNVSLNNQLVKTFNSHLDESLYFTELTDYIASIANINDNIAQQLDNLRTQFTETRQRTDAAISQQEGARAEFDSFSTTTRNSILQEARNAGVDPATLDAIGGMDLEQIMAAHSSPPAGRDDGLTGGSALSDIVRGFSPAIQEARARLNTTIEGLQETINGQTDVLTNQLQPRAEEFLGSILGRELSGRSNMSRNFETLGVSSNYILSEELADDARQRISGDSIAVLLDMLANSPTTFKRVAFSVLSRPREQITTRSNDPRYVALARAKYYEGHAVDTSMITASLTIKGDPFWVESYSSVKKMKDIYGTSNVSGTLPNDTTNINGSNNIMIVENTLADNDEFDNQQIQNLFTYIYTVRKVRSMFSNGLFTQELELIKNIIGDGFTRPQTRAGGSTVLPEAGDGSGEQGVGLDAFGGPGGAVGQGGTQGGTITGDDLGEGNGNATTAGVGRGTDPRRIVQNGYLRSRDGLGTFIDTLVNSPVPTTQQSANAINALNETRMAAAYGSEEAARDLVTYENNITETFGENAQEFADVINSDPSVAAQVSPELIALMSTVYGDDVSQLLNSPVDTSNVMMEITELDTRAALSVDGIMAQPSIVIRSLPDPTLRTPTPVELSYQQAIVDDAIPAYSMETYSKPYDNTYSESRREFIDTVTVAERAYVTASEATLLARISEEQESILATTNGSWTALTDEQREYYDRLNSTRTTIEQQAANDPYRFTASVRDHYATLDNLSTEYQELDQTNFDWSNAEREERISRMEEVSGQIAELDANTPDINTTRVTVETVTGAISNTTTEVKPAVPSNIVTYRLQSPVSSVDELTEEQRNQYAIAMERYDSIFDPNLPRVPVTIEWTYDGITETYQETLPVVPNNIATEYGIVNPISGGTYNVDDQEVAQWEVRNINTMVTEKIINDLPEIGFSSPGGYASVDEKLNTTSSGPLQLEVTAPQIIILNDGNGE